MENKKKKKNFNHKMHYRNIYKENPPNFIELANKYENFKKLYFFFIVKFLYYCYN